VKCRITFCRNYSQPAAKICRSDFNPTTAWRHRIFTWLTTALIVPLLFVTPVQAHHSALPAGMSEPEATWLWGYHTIPAGITSDNSPYWYGYPHTDVNRIDDPAWHQVAEKKIRADAKAPAVLVMHGCAGIVRGPAQYRLFFMNRGYAVFEPDSFARPGRKPCNDDALDQRIEELGHALGQIRDLSWVDADRIVLMGISEGGAAVANWSEPGVQAHIILADDCSGERPGAPDNTPVLAIVGGEDEYFGGNSCKVTRTIKGSASIVIPGAPHGVSDLPEAQSAMAAFLGQCCQ